MAEIAVMVLSPIVQAFFDKMASGQFVDFFRGRKLNVDLLVRLKIKLRSVNAVLKDAEDKQFTMPDVKEWVDAVYDVVYDAEQVLDEISTKALQRKLDVEFGTFGSKVRNFTLASSFVKVEKQIQKLLDILDFLVNEKDNLRLREGEGVGGNPSERLPSTSLVDESHTFGRRDDKEAVINSLLSDGASGDDMGVIAIVGMGGIGKTTLAQLVYNDDRLKEHFNHRVWVCVSEDFDVLKLTKIIAEKVTGKTYDTNDLDQLQSKLKEELMKKKFLIVLDDVWNKKLNNWELLSIPFKFGAQGSRVIVTTRNQEVASVMCASITYPINELPKEYCWLLFATYAFHKVNLYAYPKLEEIGRQIVEKCKGLPLAIKATGALLQSNLDINEWYMVLRSDLWDSPIKETDIIPALRLSYKYLSPPLRRCFAYCSIFPKDHTFEKDELVFLWMAEGFLPQLQNKTMKEVGDDYFLALVSRSLFQRSQDNKYVMHDLVSDLTKFISKEFTLCHEDDSSREVLSKTRHISYSSHNFYTKKFETFHRAKGLRTIVKINYCDYRTNFLLSKIRYLRVLILSNDRSLTELPDAIGKLKQLRYVNLAYTWIERLPDSLCKLCNLQILNLSNCRSLVALPKYLYKLINLQILNLNRCSRLAALPSDVHKLTNLHHLDITKTAIIEMPINLSKLKCLQTLPIFIISKHSRSGIEELGKLTSLRGKLSVLELQNIGSPAYAKDVNLRDKYLEELELKWGVGTASALESHKGVLDCLEPHSILRSLSIYGYGGTSFPNWVGDASFSNIASLRLEYCNFCCSLPPLGQLPSLQHLSIVGFDGVVTVGRQFYGSGSSSIKPFGALKYLRFEKTLEWKEWFPFEAENEGGALHF